MKSMRGCWPASDLERWMDKKQLALNEQESIVLHHLRPWKTYQID